mgnify:CR=1 FL=1|jgi:hypothetical protein
MIFKKIRNIFIKNQGEERDLKEMSKKEKKQFLTNDFIDRMIKVEQRVFASLGEHLPFNKTNYYKGLKIHEKKNYIDWVKLQKNKLRATLLLLFALSVPFFLLSGGITGYSIHKNPEFFQITGLIIIVLAIIISSTYHFGKKKKRKKFHGHFQILDNIIKKRPYK